MKPEIECRCGCLGVRDFHDAARRVRREMLVREPAKRRKPVTQGKRTDGKGFGALDRHFAGGGA